MEIGRREREREEEEACIQTLEVSRNEHLGEKIPHSNDAFAFIASEEVEQRKVGAQNVRRDLSLWPVMRRGDI